MLTYVFILIGLFLLFNSYKKNKPLHLVVLIFFAVFSRDYIPVGDLQIMGLFKIWDTVILWLMLNFFLSKATFSYAHVPIFFRNILIIWAIILFISFINSLFYQTSVESVKSYRAGLWLMTPFVLNQFLPTKKTYDFFFKYLIYLILIINCLFILQSLFPTIPFIPNTGVSTSDFGGRVYGFSFILNNIGGMYCLCMYFVKNDRKYLWFFLIILAAMALSLARSASVGFFASTLVAIFLLKKYYIKNLFSGNQFKTFTICVLLIIVLAGAFGVYQIFEKRYVDITIAQYESEDNQFLTGRWAKFERRYEWLEQQGDYFNYFGVGRLQPSLTREWDPLSSRDLLLEKERVADAYLACESGYLNSILSYGLVGGFGLIITFLSMIRYAIKSLKKEPIIRIESIIAISALIYIVFFNISGNLLDEVNSFFQFGIIILMLAPKKNADTANI